MAVGECLDDLLYQDHVVVFLQPVIGSDEC